MDRTENGIINREISYILDGNNDNGDDNKNHMTLHLMSVKHSITELPGNLETVSPVHILELILLTNQVMVVLAMSIY